MEEKKLTDDEKLLKQIRYLADRYGTANCIGNPSKNFFIDTLDLIHRLQNEVSQFKSKAEHIEEVYNADREHFIKTTTEQKAEIERLTEENDKLVSSLSCERVVNRQSKELLDNFHECDKLLRKENAELQKQVDELKMEKARAMRGCEWLSDCQSQAVKNTAKKCNDFMHALICKYNGYIDRKDGAYGNMHKEADEFVKERYGVEAE